MPTKSSARWIADGDNMVKVLQGEGLQDRPAVRRRRHPEPARADREHDHQGRQGAGDRRHRRHHAVRRAAEGGRQGHQGHRLRPPDPRLEERRLLRHLRQLPGRRAAGRLDRRQARPEGTARARSTSSCSAARPTTTTPSSSTTARCRCCKPYIDSGKLVVRSKQMGMDKVGTLRWDGAVAQARMDNLLSRLLRQGQGVDAVLSPYDGLSIGILSSLKGVGYGTRAAALPGRHRPGRRGAVGQVDARAASSTRPCSRTRANWPRSRPTWSTRCWPARQPEINDTKTYNNGVKVVPSLPAQAGERGRVELEAGADRQRLLQGSADQVMHRGCGPQAQRPAGAGPVLACRSCPRQPRRHARTRILEMRGITKTLPRREGARAT